MNERYAQIASDLPYDDGVDVLLVVRRPDGSETKAAVFHGASVRLEIAHAVEKVSLDGFAQSVPTGSVMQATVTAVWAEVHDSQYFNRAPQISSPIREIQ